jgi:D-galactarolactone isomerase
VAKLSGPYLNSRERGFADTLTVAQAWVAAAPDRLVWGSDWPHATEQPHPPDTLALLDLLAAWVPDAALRQRILVDNAAALYGFASPAPETPTPTP